MQIIVTGAAGFVGFHAAKRLLQDGHTVIGIDNLNDYYPVQLKKDRLAQLQAHANFCFELADIFDRDHLSDIFDSQQPERVLHLAAQAGVRYSIQHPHAYADANLVGFLNILESCRQAQVQHLVFASSSSVYGANRKTPFSPHDPADHPMSLYAATKKANELMAHAYSHLYRLPVTGLRFFTVYGPYGRPDMAYFTFTKAILEGRPIEIFNNGNLARDFTYIDDIIEGVVRVLFHTAAPNPDWCAQTPDPGSSTAPYRIYNIGNSTPVPLMRFIAAIEQSTGKSAVKNMLPMQPGDVLETHADTADLEAAIGFAPNTSVETGVARFVEWYRSYYGEPEAN
jgi:UDP-glucuronate 4-epimerase